jgi:hypothetical protein
LRLSAGPSRLTNRVYGPPPPPPPCALQQAGPSNKRNNSKAAAAGKKRKANAGTVERGAADEEVGAAVAKRARTKAMAAAEAAAEEVLGQEAMAGAVLEGALQVCAEWGEPGRWADMQAGDHTVVSWGRGREGLLHRLGLSPTGQSMRFLL